MTATHRFVLALIVGCTLAQWLILAAQIPIFANLPDWFWPLGRRPLDSAWLLLPASALAIGVILFVVRQPGRTALNLLLLIILGVTLQFGFAFAEGRGLDGLRDRIVSTGHAEFARVAVEQASIGDVLVNYEQLSDAGELGAYARSKPPGQLLLYMLSERLAHLVQPHQEGADRLVWSQTVAALLWPILGYLVLVPLYFFARLLLDQPSAWRTTLLYLFVPSVTLMTLQTDQVFFPLLFTLCLLAGLVAVRADRGWLLLLTGGLVYLSVFVSFALVVVTPFLLGFVIHNAQFVAGPRLPKVGRQLLLILAGALLLDLLLRWRTGYDLLVRYQAAVAYHQAWKGWENNLLDVTYYAGLNLLEYATWIGAPLTILAGLGIWRAFALLRLPAPRLIVTHAVILAGVICALALFGRTKAEVARLWLFLLPCLCLVAAYELDARFARRSSRIFYLVLALQAGTIALIKLNQDFW